MRQYLVVRDPQIIIAGLQKKALRDSRLQPRETAPPQPTESKPAQTAAGVPTETVDHHWNGSSAAPTPSIPPGIASVARSNGGDATGLAKVDEARRKAETEVIVQALNSTLWNRKRAAALLGTDYKALLYKMKKLGIG